MSNKAVVYGSNHPMDAQEQCHHLAVASRPVSHCMEWCTNSKYICSARCLDLLLSSQVFCHCDVAFSVCCVPKYSSQVPYCQLACILTALFIPMLVILTTYLFMISFEIKVLFNAACKPTAFYQRCLSPHLRQVAKCLKTRRCEQNFIASTVSKTHKLRCWQQPQISFYESLLRNQSCMSNNADYDNHSQECVFNWDARTLWFFNLENRFWSPQGSAPNFEPHSSLSSSDPRILDRRFLESSKYSLPF